MRDLCLRERGEMAYVGMNQYHGQMADEYDYDDTDDFFDNNHLYNNSNSYGADDSEDTEEASESEYGRTGRNHDEPLEIKEQMYQDKLANLKKQLEELKSNTHPEYIRRFRKLEAQYKERLRVNEVHRDFSVECVEREYITEKKAAVKEYDEKKSDLRENLISDFEEKRKLIEAERHSMELTGDSTEAKPTVTRKLRRRPNEPVPVAAEKRRKPTVSQLVLLLDEKEIDNDLKMISRGKAMNPIRPPTVGNNGMTSMGSPLTIASSLPPTENYSMVETKIEDGKLLYERRWFHRGQPVYIEGKDVPKFPATISAIGNEVVWVKKVNDNNKVKILTSHLSRGKIAIKRRAN